MLQNCKRDDDNFLSRQVVEQWPLDAFAPVWTAVMIWER